MLVSLQHFMFYHGLLICAFWCVLTPYIARYHEITRICTYSYICVKIREQQNMSNAHVVPNHTTHYSLFTVMTERYVQASVRVEFISVVK